jgi:hypothetical protein
MKKIKICPFCFSDKVNLFAHAENRDYLHCKICDLVFVPKEFFISKKDEKAKYDNHQNTPENQGYQDFLNKLIVPLCSFLPKQAKGLDFGSGPGPTLSVMMEKLGFEMEIYDYFYHNNHKVFEKKYDFITTTEVIEHLHNPQDEILKLWGCLKEGGVLGIMTAFRPDDKAFLTWYYKRDLTHVRFFTKVSFEWLADKLEAQLVIPQSGVVILKKRKT